jgi:hypothetical protein
MQHASEILASPRLAMPSTAPPPWQRAAKAAEGIARARTADPATLPQLSRVCQLLTSHTVSACERRRALRRLTEGCTREQASTMLDYLFPRVHARKTKESARLLRPLLSGTPPAADA